MIILHTLLLLHGIRYIAHECLKNCESSIFTILNPLLTHRASVDTKCSESLVCEEAAPSEHTHLPIIHYSPTSMREGQLFTHHVWKSQ